MEQVQINIGKLPPLLNYSHRSAKFPELNRFLLEGIRQSASYSLKHRKIK